MADRGVLELVPATDADLEEQTAVSGSSDLLVNPVRFYAINMLRKLKQINPNERY